MKIIAKLIVVIEILVVISIVVTGYMSLQVGAKAIEGRTEAQLESVVILKANQLNTFIDGRARYVTGVTISHVIEENLNAFMETNDDNHVAIVRNRLNGFLIANPSFFELFIVGLDGKVDVSTDPTQEGKIKSNEQYFISGMENCVVQSFYYDVALHQSAITMASPIKDDNGTTISVLAARVNLSKISMILMERSGLGETGETYLVNDFNFAVTQLRGNETVSFEKAIYTEVVDVCLKEKSPNVQFMSGYLNYAEEEVMGAYAYLPELKVCLIAEVGQEEAFEPMTRFGNELIFISSLTIIVALILGYFMSKMITKPITTLRDVVNKISKGDLDTKMEIKTGDEIGELASAFKQMTKNLKKHQESLEELVTERTRELEKKIDELEKFKKVTVNRELKMVEMKKRIKELKQKLQGENK